MWFASNPILQTISLFSLAPKELDSYWRYKVFSEEVKKMLLKGSLDVV